MSARAAFADLTMVIAPGWLDITEDLPPGSPPTLAKADGIGVLQFSVAKHSAGVVPTVTSAVLESLLNEFVDGRRGVGPSRQGVGSHPFVSCDVVSEGEFLRIWYVSNGRDVAMVTYLAQDQPGPGVVHEAEDAGDIVASVDFT